MTWPASAADPAGAEPPEARGELRRRPGRDGSFSLWSEAFGEGFHSAEGALAEARATFLLPSELERFAPGQPLTVLEVAVGTGTNSAVLIDACRARGLELRWWGLELDPRPLRLALADPGFRGSWPAAVLGDLEQLLGGPTLLWGDARSRLADLPPQLRGGCDLLWLDAFSPRRCPQLWSLEFLAALARLLRADGRLISYGSAAAFRSALRSCGLELAAIRRPPGDGSGPAERWSGGTVASPAPLPAGGPLRPFTPMEEEHLATRAAEPYRDPTGTATAEQILAGRLGRQRLGHGASTSAWRRRWGLDRRPGSPVALGQAREAR